MDVAFFAVSVDDAETNKQFAESLDANYPILSDPSKEVAKSYGVLHERGFAKRWTFYIDKDGIVRHIDKDVDVHTAGETVVTKSKEYFDLED